MEVWPQSARLSVFMSVMHLLSSDAFHFWEALRMDRVLLTIIQGNREKEAPVFALHWIFAKYSKHVHTWPSPVLVAKMWTQLLAVTLVGRHLHWMQSFQHASAQCIGKEKVTNLKVLKVKDSLCLLLEMSTVVKYMPTAAVPINGNGSVYW